MGPGTVSTETRLEGIPISLFVVMCSLALLGIVYAIAIMVFNVAKQSNKLVFYYITSNSSAVHMYRGYRLLVCSKVDNRSYK
jgi:hypothetical protein